MDRFTQPPRHRSLILWGGASVIAFLLWLWRDALGFTTILGLRDLPWGTLVIHPEGISFYAGALFIVGPGIFHVLDTWDPFGAGYRDFLIYFRDSSDVRVDRWSQKSAFTVSHPSLILMATATWFVALWLRRMLGRRILRTCP